MENNPAVKKPTVRENLERIIDDILTQKPDSFEGFVKLLSDAGCEVKQVCTYPSKRPDKRNICGCVRCLAIIQRTLSVSKLWENMMGLLLLRKLNHSRFRKKSLLIDVQNPIKAQNSPGYERWAKTYRRLYQD